MKYKKTAEFKISQAQAIKIGQILAAEITGSRQSNARVYKLADRCEKQYHQVTAWEAKNKVCNTPWEGAADYFVPLTEWTVDAVHSRAMNVLFGVEGALMEATGRNAKGQENQGAIRDFIDMILKEEVRIRQNIEYFIKQMIKIPMAVLKYDWVNEYDKMVVKESALVLSHPDTGEERYILPDDPDRDEELLKATADGFIPTPDMKEVWVEKDVEVTDGPRLRYIKFEDYVWAPKTKAGKKPFWEGDRGWLTLNDLRLKARQKKFIPESVEYVIGQVDADLSSDNAGDRNIKKRSEQREVYNWYGRLPTNKTNEIDFEGPDTLEQEFLVVLDLKAQVVLQISAWPYTRKPTLDRVYIRGSFEDTDSFHGRSLCQKLFKTQYELNDFTNTLMNNAWIAMQKIFVRKHSTVDSQLEDPTVFPGAIWEEMTTGDIRVLDVGDVKAISFELNNILIGYAERLSNISIYQTGTARQVGGAKTKGEVDSTISEGNISLDRFLSRAHEVLKVIAHWTVSYYKERMPEGLERRINADNGETIFPTPETEGLYQEKGLHPFWRGEDLDGEVAFDWIGTSLNSNKNRAIAISNDLMDRFMAHPMIGGSLIYTWEILKRGLIARGISDWQKILPPKEAVVAEMRQMKAEAAAQKQMAAAPSVESLAVKKLMDKGIPQDQAMQAVAKATSNQQGAQPTNAK